MGDLSKHLSLAEYKCPCCGGLPPDFYDEDSVSDLYMTLFQQFDDIRDMFGKPIKINSGYRCVKHNTDVGGEPLSVHLFGLALDMDAANESEVEWLAECVERTHDDLRMGKYTRKATFVHVDCGHYIYPRASRAWKAGARWTG